MEHLGFSVLGTSKSGVLDSVLIDALHSRSYSLCLISVKKRLKDNLRQNFDNGVGYHEIVVRRSCYNIVYNLLLSMM